MFAVPALDDFESLRSVALSSLAGFRIVKELYLDLRIGMDGRDDRFLVFIPNDHVIT